MFELHNVGDMLAAFIGWQNTYSSNAENALGKTNKSFEDSIYKTSSSDLNLIQQPFRKCSEYIYV